MCLDLSVSQSGLMDIVSAFPRAMSEVQRLEGSFKDLKGMWMISLCFQVWWMLKKTCMHSDAVELGHVLLQAQKAKGAKQNAPDDPVEVLAQLHQVGRRRRDLRQASADDLSMILAWYS